MPGESAAPMGRQPEAACRRDWLPVVAPMRRREPKSVQEPVRWPVSPTDGGESDE